MNDFINIYKSCKNHGDSRISALFTAARMWREVREARENCYAVFWKPDSDDVYYSPAHPDIDSSWNYYSVVPTRKGWVPAPWLGTSDSWTCSGFETMKENDEFIGWFTSADKAISWCESLWTSPAYKSPSL